LVLLVSTSVAVVAFKPPIVGSALNKGRKGMVLKDIIIWDRVMETLSQPYRLPKFKKEENGEWREFTAEDTQYSSLRRRYVFYSSYMYYIAEDTQ
jgi:hypothetical protein